MVLGIFEVARSKGKLKLTIWGNTCHLFFM